MYCLVFFIGSWEQVHGDRTTIFLSKNACLRLSLAVPTAFVFTVSGTGLARAQEMRLARLVVIGHF